MLQHQRCWRWRTSVTKNREENKTVNNIEIIIGIQLESPWMNQRGQFPKLSVVHRDGLHIIDLTLTFFPFADWTCFYLFQHNVCIFSNNCLPCGVCTCKYIPIATSASYICCCTQPQFAQFIFYWCTYYFELLLFKIYFHIFFILKTLLCSGIHCAQQSKNVIAQGNREIEFCTSQQQIIE